MRRLEDVEVVDTLGPWRLRAALTPTGWKGAVIFGARIVESEAVTRPVLS